jgi:acyl-CoA synthetase (NDP forming)
MQHVLAPESVAVIGASRRRGTVGRAILDNFRAGGYAGRLYTVNPRPAICHTICEPGREDCRHAR